MAKINIKDAYSLNRLLEERLGNRIQTDPLMSLGGSVCGEIDSKRFNITFSAGEYLLLSTEESARDMITELTPILEEVMDSKSLCTYDLESLDSSYQGVMPTIEWDITDPEKRLKDLANNRAYTSKTKVSNIVLTSGESIDKYQETEEEKQQRLKNARIYGIDPGSIKEPKKIKEISELDLYFLIDELGRFIWRCRHDMAHGRIDSVDLTEECYALEYLVYQTTRFGVELEEPQIDQHIHATPSYNAWYNFYSNHFKETLTDEEWNNFMKAKKNNQDITPFLPQGSWKDTLEKPKQKEKIEDK